MNTLTYLRQALLLGFASWCIRIGVQEDVFRTLPSAVYTSIFWHLVLLLFAIALLTYFRPRTNTFPFLCLTGLAVLLWSCWTLKGLPGKQEISIFATFIHTLSYVIVPLWLLVICNSWGKIIEKKVPLYGQTVGAGFACILLSLIPIFFLPQVSTLSIWAWLFLMSMPFFWSLKKRTFTLPNIKGRLRKTEMLLIACLLLLFSSFSLQLLRPIPVGWDDLGVYMNYARQIAILGEVPSGIGMIPATLFVSAGHLVGGITQAFFFSLMTVVVMCVVIFQLFYSLSQHRLHSLLGTTIVLATPMVQSLAAVDLKIDIFVVIIGSLILHGLIHHAKTKTQFSAREYIWVGILMGLLFTIKLTGLYIIVAVLIGYGYVWGGWKYVGLAASGFLFFGGITGLLYKMFIDVVPGDVGFHTFTGAIFLIMIGVICRQLRRPKKHFVSLAIIIVSALIPLSPWIIKNSHETIRSGQTLSIDGLIHGRHLDAYEADFSQIKKEKKEGQKENFVRSVTKKKDDNLGRCGVVDRNEDFGRFRNGECGLAPFLTLPGHLSFSIAKVGALGDATIVYIIITFLLAALASTTVIRILVFAVSGVLFVLINAPGTALSSFVQENLSAPIFPWGYIIVLSLSLLLGWMAWGPKYPLTTKVTIISGSSYLFLWWVSAQGIPWYGILGMILLLCITYGVRRRIVPQEKLTYFVAGWIVIGAFLIQYAIIHPLGELNASGYLQYKNRQHTTYQSFSHTYPEVTVPLIFVNVTQSHLPQELQNPNAQNIFEPKPPVASHANIYRVGTFLKYFIHDNLRRVHEDFLLFDFDKHISHEDSSIVGERFQKIDTDYIIVDPNLGAIDESDEKGLQKRYESLMFGLKSDKTPLLHTDNICINLAYAIDDLSGDDFRLLVSVGYPSKIAERAFSVPDKRAACIHLINELIKEQRAAGGVRGILQKYDVADPSIPIAESLGNSFYVLFGVTQDQ